jgi:hypothetical protein
VPAEPDVGVRPALDVDPVAAAEEDAHERLPAWSRAGAEAQVESRRRLAVERHDAVGVTVTCVLPLAVRTERMAPPVFTAYRVEHGRGAAAESLRPTVALLHAVR